MKDRKIVTMLCFTAVTIVALFVGNHIIAAIAFVALLWRTLDIYVE